MSFWTGKASYRWIILVACMLVYCTSQLVRWNYASITKYLTTDLGIGKPELGLLGSAFFYAYAVAQIPWGSATDMFGGRRVIPVGITILSLFLIGFAFSATFTEAMIWRALMGFVAAAGYVPITAVLSKWFSVKERGFAMEMYSGPGGGLGEALTFLLIYVVLLFLFPSNYRKPVLIMLMLPLVFIGVVWGLLLFGKSLDFFAILGLLGLIGMNIKNAIVLVDEIGLQLKDGKGAVPAVVEATKTRIVPVTMASGTTILGMLPLLGDAMFAGMAATIMGGLFVSTVLTIFVLPVTYCIFFKIRADR